MTATGWEALDEALKPEEGVELLYADFSDPEKPKTAAFTKGDLIRMKLDDPAYKAHYIVGELRQGRVSLERAVEHCLRSAAYPPKSRHWIAYAVEAVQHLRQPRWPVKIPTALAAEYLGDQLPVEPDGMTTVYAGQIVVWLDLEVFAA